MNIYFIVGGFILFDIITGVFKALSKEGINSTKIRAGLYHKMSEILSVLFAYFLEYSATVVHLGIDLPMVEAVSVYICLMEAVSIIENICELNPTLRKFFSPYLQKLRTEEVKNG